MTFFYSLNYFLNVLFFVIQTDLAENAVDFLLFLFSILFLRLWTAKMSIFAILTVFDVHCFFCCSPDNTAADIEVLGSQRRQCFLQ